MTVPNLEVKKGHRLHGKKGRKYFFPETIIIKEKFNFDSTI